MWGQAINGRASKNKGHGFERELVQKAKAFGLEAERAYASNGRALGETEAVDAIVGGARIQAKRRKSIASFLQIPAGADAVVFREDRGTALVLLPYDDFCRLLDSAGGFPVESLEKTDDSKRV